MDFFQFTKKRVKPPTLIVDDVRLVECVSRCVNRSVQFVIAVAVSPTIETPSTSPVVALFAEELTFKTALVALSKDLLLFLLLLTLIPFPLCCRSVVLYIWGILPFAVLVVVVVLAVSAVKAVRFKDFPISVSVVVSAENSAGVVFVGVFDFLLGRRHR